MLVIFGKECHSLTQTAKSAGNVGVPACTEKMAVLRSLVPMERYWEASCRGTANHSSQVPADSETDKISPQLRHMFDFCLQACFPALSAVSCSATVLFLLLSACMCLRDNQVACRNRGTIEQLTISRTLDQVMCFALVVESAKTSDLRCSLLA